MYVLADVPKEILEILDNVIDEKGLSPLNQDLAGYLQSSEVKKFLFTVQK